MNTLRSRCPKCDQKFEFHSEMQGQRHVCPSCGVEFHLWGPVIQHKPSKIDARHLLIGFWILLFATVGIFGYINDTNPNSSYQQTVRAFDEQQAEIKHNEQVIRDANHLVYGGIKVETDDQVHQEAVEMQKEQEQGIGTPSN